jgi:DNA-binding CsgD family transcriptional regulator
LIVSTSRIAPNVRGTKVKTRWPVACHFEIGTSESEGKKGSTAARTTRLTRREQQIVDLLLEGCENIEIARQLRIAQRTVKACFNRLFLRFGITSGIKRVKLATLLYRNELCSDVILTGSDAQPKGNTESLEEFEPGSPSSRTVFEPCMTSWESGTVSSLPGGVRREVTTTGPTSTRRSRAFSP